MIVAARPIRLHLALWRPMLPAVVAVLLLLLLFRETLAAMVDIWARSGTYAHAYLVPPIVLWLIWRQRAWITQAPVQPAPMWLLPMVPMAVLWLLGQIVGVNAATQFALVSLIVMSVPATVGWKMARRLAFPLLFLFFAVPLGEFLVDPMMEATADFTVLALRFSGIPVYREGLQFVIPSGNWSVVEACSGVRYLIASVMVGALFAHLNYRSRARQLLFVCVAVLVPVLANWLRAYMIVMLGHYSGNTLAVGVDHLLYGWIFFGVVIGLMFFVGGRFAESAVAPTGAADPAPPPASGAATSAGWLTAAAIAVLALATQGLLARLQRESDGPLPTIELPARLGAGWTKADAALSSWAPVFNNPSAIAMQTYVSGSDRVAVWVGYYRDQNYQRKLVSSTNVLVDQRSVAWLPLPQAQRSVRVGDQMVTFRGALLRSPADPKVSPVERLLVLHAYRVSHRLLVGDVEAALRLAVDRLLGRGDDSAVLMFYTAVDDPAQAAAVLERFIAGHLDAIVAAVDAAGSSRAPAR